MPWRRLRSTVLDHDDRVVDDDADRQHQAEQREVVEAEAHRQHHGEGADQRDRDGEDRDHRRAPGLQEQDDHDHDQATASKIVSITASTDSWTNSVGL